MSQTRDNGYRLKTAIWKVLHTFFLHPFLCVTVVSFVLLKDELYMKDPIEISSQMFRKFRDFPIFSISFFFATF